jgi:Fe-S cluster biosynthesis and repair protein YggX
MNKITKKQTFIIKEYKKKLVKQNKKIKAKQEMHNFDFLL